MHFLLGLAVATLVSADAFSINTYADDSDFDEKVLHAYNYTFLTGLPGPSTHCPSSIGSRCPAVAGTLVGVPGGQEIYVQPDGQVKYTMAHSAYKPPGAIVGHWHHKAVPSPAKAGSIDVVIDFDDGNGHSGLVLCFYGGASYALYAKTGNFDADGCVDLTEIEGLVMTRSENQLGCWQYT
ncbi:hypothetical protein GGR51DRAFT_557180 [Nemania sp. FL0031]|nr:hypothetical protein GGR51DRAFT_557180 [Nemania sp. FL0031]